MSDLIKKIKIKKQDGTYTDYIPIGAEAKNVDCSDGESVEYKLNKKPYYYNSVADMKADTSLKVGDMTVTLGYYEANDGGGAEYRIVKGNYEDDGGICHKIENNLFAELIYKDCINVDQLGAKGDNSFDNTTLFNKIFNNKNFKKITLSKDKIYVCNETVTIKKDFILDGQLGVLKSLSSNEGFVIEILPEAGQSVHNTVSGIITRVRFQGENCSILLNNKQGYKGLISECYFSNFTGIGLKHTRGYEMLYDTLRFIGKGQDCVGIYCNNNDVHFNNIYMRDCKTGFKLYCSADYFDECHGWLLDPTLYEGSKFIEIYGQGMNYMNNIQADTYQYGIYFGAYGYIIADNYKCLFGQTPSLSAQNDSYAIYYANDNIANYDWKTNLKNVIIDGTNAKTHFSNVDYINSHISCNIISSTNTEDYLYNNNFYPLTEAASNVVITKQEVTRDNENQVHLSFTAKITNGVVGWNPIAGLTFSVVPKTYQTVGGIKSTSDYLTPSTSASFYLSTNIQVYLETAGTQTVQLNTVYLAKNDRRNV